MLKIVLSLFLMGLSTYACASQKPEQAIETIRYKIMQMGVKAGNAVLEFKGPAVYQGMDVFLIEFTADGFNFYDKEKIYTDPVHFRPLFVERDLNIFGKKEKIFEKYDSAAGTIEITKKVGDKTFYQTLPNKGEVDNIYGFIYRFRRNGEFKLGETLQLNLPTTDIAMVLLKREEITVAGKKFDSFYMQSKPAKYKLWFDASAQRLPLRISGAVGIANTMMVMTE